MVCFFILSRPQTVRHLPNCLIERAVGFGVVFAVCCGVRVPRDEQHMCILKKTVALCWAKQSGICKSEGARQACSPSDSCDRGDPGLKWTSTHTHTDTHKTHSPMKRLSPWMSHCTAASLQLFVMKLVSIKLSPFNGRRAKVFNKKSRLASFPWPNQKQYNTNAIWSCEKRVYFKHMEKKKRQKTKQHNIQK